MRQEDASLWKPDCSRGKAKAISHQCHHPIRSGWKTFVLLLHIHTHTQYKALEESSVASCIKMHHCAAEGASTFLRRRTRVFEQNALDAYHSVHSVIGGRFFRAVLAHRAVCCMSTVSLVLSKESITHLSTSIFLWPMGLKCPSLGQKENWQDGSGGLGSGQSGPSSRFSRVPGSVFRAFSLSR